MTLALTASLLYTPLERIEDPLVIIEDQRIVAAAPRSALEAPKRARLLEFPDAVLAPGFVDIHIHGGAGCDVMQADGLEPLERFLAQHGVTSYLPTTVTAPVDSTLASLDRLARAIEQSAQSRSSDGPRAQPLGIHMEGPFISRAKRGVHSPDHLLEPSREMLERFWRAAHGHLRMMTVAPELRLAPELIAEAAQRGICVSLGHSDGGSESAQAAIAAGARHATHTFNAMRPLDHREPGILGVVLTDERLTADIIADGVHVHPEVVALFLKAKGAERAVLITDALSATGMGDGRYRLGMFEVQVRGARCEREGRLAGSVLTLDRALSNVMQFTGCSLQQALRLVTLNPARVAALTPCKGLIAPGADADLVVLTPKGEVVKTLARGAEA